MKKLIGLTMFNNFCLSFQASAQKLVPESGWVPLTNPVVGQGESTSRIDNFKPENKRCVNSKLFKTVRGIRIA